MGRNGKQSYYEILDVNFNANPEVIRTAYIRAKNAYNRDSLAAYSLFDQEESRKILDEIEEAFTILSDSEKRRKYDESHGIISSESVYDSYHKGNHAVAAFARDGREQNGERYDEDPFRRTEKKTESAAPSHVDRLKAMQNSGSAIGSVKNYQVSRDYQVNEEMEERIRKAENVCGAFLRSVREYKRMSPEEIMDILKIGRNYLTALEEDDVARLPANVFVRGFVIQYAKALKLDHEKIASAYMEFLRSKRPS